MLRYVRDFTSTNWVERFLSQLEETNRNREERLEERLELQASLLLETYQRCRYRVVIFNLEGVLSYARSFREAGCTCHLLGTHIQPRRNWNFLANRMASGQAFGRYITKEQSLTGLRRYQTNLERILDEEDLRHAFDSIHVYDVMEDGWCVSLSNKIDPPPTAPEA